MGNFRDWVNDSIPSFGGYNAFYNLTHPWKPIQGCLLEAKWAWQRVFKGHDDRAVWNMGFYLSDLISKLATELKENNIGTPWHMWDGMTPINDNFNYSEEDNKMAEDKWHEILDKIIVGFKSYPEFCDIYDQEDSKLKILKSQFNEGFDLFKKYFDDLWD